LTRYLPAIILLLCTQVCYANLQGKARLDSLITELNDNKWQPREDSMKVWLFYSVSYLEIYIDPDAGIKYGFDGLKLAQKIPWEKGIGMMNSALALNYDSKSEFQKALEFNFKALMASTEANNKADMAMSYGNIGNDYNALGDYAKALDYTHKALEIYEETNNFRVLPFALMSISDIYHSLNNYEKAIEYDSIALAKFTLFNDKPNIARCLFNLGAIYSEENNNLPALNFLNKSILRFDSLGDLFGLAAALCEAGQVNLHLRDHQKGLSLFRRSLELSRTVGSKEFMAGNESGLGNAYLMMVSDTAATGVTGKNNLIDSAIIYLERGLAYHKESRMTKFVMEDNQNLSQAYRQKGDYKAALQHFEEAMQAKDSLFSNDNRLKVAALETKREADLKSHEIKINNLLENQKKQERVAYLAGIGALFLISGTIYRNARRQNRLYKLLKEEKNKSDRLMTSLEESLKQKESLLRQKDMLMKEIHHRVKNNLQVITTMLDLQLDNIADAKAQKAVTEGMSRIKSISLIHQQLYQTENVATIEFSKFVNELLK